MNIKTYRAKTMQEALSLVRHDLGPEASVLHTREVRSGGLLGWMNRTRQIEVVASASVAVPSRLPARDRTLETLVAAMPATARRSGQEPLRRRPPLEGIDAGPDLHAQLAELHEKVEELCRRSRDPSRPELSESLFALFTDLIEADICEELARQLVERVRVQVVDHESHDAVGLKARLADMVEADIPVAGPIRTSPGERRLVALVGPTGVGKTTTIAKLAANFRLREKLRVGLITVDTYRIAAVEQLRTYADIIDLPMEIVATPREMHQAVARMADLDLILMDTAGRSPAMKSSCKSSRPCSPRRRPTRFTWCCPAWPAPRAWRRPPNSLPAWAPRHWSSPSWTRPRRWATCCRWCAAAACRSAI